MPFDMFFFSFPVSRGSSIGRDRQTKKEGKVWKTDCAMVRSKASNKSEESLLPLDASFSIHTWVETEGKKEHRRRWRFNCAINCLLFGGVHSVNKGLLAKVSLLQMLGWFACLPACMFLLNGNVQ